MVILRVDQSRKPFAFVVCFRVELFQRLQFTFDVSRIIFRAFQLSVQLFQLRFLLCRALIGLFQLCFQCFDFLLALLDVFLVALDGGVIVAGFFVIEQFHESRSLRRKLRFGFRLFLSSRFSFFFVFANIFNTDAFGKLGVDFVMNVMDFRIQLDNFRLEHFDRLLRRHAFGN